MSKALTAYFVVPYDLTMLQAHLTGNRVSPGCLFLYFFLPIACGTATTAANTQAPIGFGYIRVKALSGQRLATFKALNHIDLIAL
jgi:hypothetical protein